MKLMAFTGSALLSATLSAMMFASGVSAQSSWDGISKKSTDAIVTLRLPKAANAVWLNGEPAITFQESDTVVRVLITSDDSGISCENVYTVKFAGDKAGQLLANHCHGDIVFNVRPGEISNNLLNKEDVDNPDDDIAQNEDKEVSTKNERPFARRAVRWNDDQFVTLDKELKWQGSGGSDAVLILSIPETDAFYWVGGCKNGITTNYIQSVNGSEKIGARVPIYIGTDQFAAARYPADVVRLPFGDGDGTDPTISLSLPVDHELFDRMTAGNWLYVISGAGENLMRTRISLAGSARAISAFRQECKTNDRLRTNSPEAVTSTADE